MKKSQLIFALFSICFAVICNANEPISVQQEEKMLLEKAQGGDPKAEFDVACFYERTQITDYPTIVLWLRRSANKGYLEAQFALGKIYHFGKPKIIKDPKEAEFWYEQAVAQGDLQAIKYLDILRQDRDYKRASAPDMDEKWNMQWTVKMAMYGDTQSQFEMGQMYLNGIKIRMDYEQAVSWFEKAATQGHIEAMFTLGNLYSSGKGIPLDMEKAIFWYNQAALRNYAPAQKKLSKILASTDYRTPDLVKAAAWLYIALRPLFPKEKDLTTVSPELDNLFSQMTQKQKEDALYFAYSFMDTQKK